jgi:hypothetical protein
VGNIAAMLSDAAMAPSDIVSVTTYVVVGEDLAPVMAARDAALGEHRAASTLVTVPALARPEWRMEVAVVAANVKPFGQEEKPPPPSKRSGRCARASPWALALRSPRPPSEPPPRLPA